MGILKEIFTFKELFNAIIVDEGKQNRSETRKRLDGYRINILQS